MTSFVLDFNGLNPEIPELDEEEGWDNEGSAHEGSVQEEDERSS